MRRLLISILVAFVFSVLSFGRAKPPVAQQADQQQNARADNKQDNKKKDKSQEDAQQTSVFSDAVATELLSQLRDGLEGHSQRLMLSAFDSDKMDGYRSFADQIQAFFERYDAFRVRYRIAQTTVEGARGIVLVDFDLEEMPGSGGGAPQRKSSQLRFELERGRKGWKIVDFRPRGFFS